VKKAEIDPRSSERTNNELKDDRRENSLGESRLCVILNLVSNELFEW